MKRSTAGLKKVKKTVNRKGKTVQQSVWVRATDAIKKHQGKIVAGVATAAIAAGVIALNRRAKFNRSQAPYRAAKGTADKVRGFRGDSPMMHGTSPRDYATNLIRNQNYMHSFLNMGTNNHRQRKASGGILRLGDGR